MSISILFDTDIGNDVDDAMALAMLHTYADKGLARILAVSINKDNPLTVPFVRMMNRLRGRPHIPVGRIDNGPTPDEGRFLKPVLDTLAGGETKKPTRAEDSVSLMRRILVEQADRSVVIVAVGFSTNLARLLASGPDDISSLDGRSLVTQKVAWVSMMAGHFVSTPQPEYNIFTDPGSARQVLEQWPTPVVFSGLEVGWSVCFPASAVSRRLNTHPRDPVALSYQVFDTMPHDRPCWDLTSVYYAVEPASGCFSLSPPGLVILDESNRTRFVEQKDGPHRYLVLPETEVDRCRTRLVDLVFPTVDTF
jgi:inosine-uridine nucleoside N-ribohydrolase